MELVCHCIFSTLMNVCKPCLVGPRTTHGDSQKWAWAWSDESWWILCFKRTGWICQNLNLIFAMFSFSQILTVTGNVECKKMAFDNFKMLKLKCSSYSTINAC